MAVTRVYQKDGTPTHTFTNSTGGPLDYLGGSQFLIGARANLDQLFLHGAPGAASTPPKLNLFSISNHSIAGVVMDRTWEHGGVDLFEDEHSGGRKIYLTLNQTIGGTQNRIRGYDYDGNFLHGFNTGAFAQVGAISGNGQEYWVAIANLTFPTGWVVRRYFIRNKSFRLVQTYTVPTDRIDMTYDGHYNWELADDGGGTIIVEQVLYDDTSRTVVSTFTPTGTAPSGITTDGYQLFINQAT